MPRKKGSPAKKRPKKTKAKAKAPAMDEASLQTQVIVQVHPTPARAASPDPDSQADAGETEPVEEGATPAATPAATATPPVTNTTMATPPATTSAVTTTYATTSAAAPSPEAPVELGEVILEERETQDAEEESLPVGKGRGQGKRKGQSALKKDWSLDAAVEEEVLEWLKGNTYLWMRSKKGYKQKRAAWEMKAQELGIDVKHLEQWWKGIKDWYVRISEKTSGQATKMLTERETWVLQHCGFYKGSIPSDTGNPLVPLARVSSATTSSTISSPPASADSDGDRQYHVLEDIESAAVAQASATQPTSTPTSSRRRGKRRREEECQEEEEAWMRDLRATMQANQALLEKLVEERPRSDREPFVRFVADTLRTAPQEQYDEMKELIFDIVRHGRRRQPGGSEQPSTPWTRAAEGGSAPPAGTASQPFPQPFSQQFGHLTRQQFSQPYNYQQYLRQYNPQYQQNLQCVRSLMQQNSTTSSLTPTQSIDEQPTYPQQQRQQQQEQTPSSRDQPMESTVPWGRLLAQDTLQGDEWNVNLSLDSTMLPPSGRSSLASQTSMNTPNVSDTSPGLQTGPQEQPQEQPTQDTTSSED